MQISFHMSLSIHTGLCSAKDPTKYGSFYTRDLTIYGLYKRPTYTPKRPTYMTRDLHILTHIFICFLQARPHNILCLQETYIYIYYKETYIYDKRPTYINTHFHMFFTRETSQYMALASRCWHPCVAVCCSVLQRGAVCCSMSQCVAVRCSALQCVAVCCAVLQCVAVCCSVLQRVAACCSVLQCVAMDCDFKSLPPGVQQTRKCPLTIACTNTATHYNTLHYTAPLPPSIKL